MSFVDSSIMFSTGSFMPPREINEVGFYENQNCQKVVAFDVLQIGELVAALTDGFKENHPTIPWAEIKGVRNQIVHHYGAVNQKILWDIACNDIPELQAFCTDVLRDVAFDM